MASFESDKIKYRLVKCVHFFGIKYLQSFTRHGENNGTEITAKSSKKNKQEK